ncbi:hypothetical protein FPZ41_32285 [Streptomyces sp. K1PN6]|uniref:Uncharacterized protein n=1 Tax=Streptomyces acidicola TaxID=2596892 RepID=A0A5N8X115_9ACTN|nr:hypothetical protein [Streptomyces acidicola]
MSLARLAHGVDVLSQEKPSGSLKSGSGQYHPSCRTASPRRKPDGSGDAGATRAAVAGGRRGPGRLGGAPGPRRSRGSPHGHSLLSCQGSVPLSRSR